MNDKNLKKNSERTPTERKLLARKAGIASGVAKREKKRLADALRSVLYEKSDNIEGLTKGQEIIVRMVRNVLSNPTADDVLKLQKILGEDVLKLDVNGTIGSERVVGLSITEIRKIEQ